MNKNHTNSSKFLSGKEVKAGRCRLDGKTYELDRENFQIVPAWRFGWRFNTITYYFVQNNPSPIDFKTMECKGISASDLDAVFAPWSLNVLSKKNQTIPVNDLGFWLQVGTAAGVGYVVMLAREIRDLLHGVGL